MEMSLIENNNHKQDIMWFFLFNLWENMIRKVGECTFVERCLNKSREGSSTKLSIKRRPENDPS